MKEIVYKDQIFHLLMLLLDHGKWEAKGETNFENNFYEEVRKKLKFQHKTDVQKYQSGVRLLGDTELAIASGFMYQLGDSNNYNGDYGEMHLRLYGILNAVYLQIGAYESIMKLLNFPEKEKVMQLFKELDIYKLRGMAGAHTADYEYDKKTLNDKPGISKTTSFTIMQYKLEKTGKSIEVIDKNGLTFEFNLLEVLSEYEKMALGLLIQLINHSINTFYIKKVEKLEMRKRLYELLPDLIDYSTNNENKKNEEMQSKKLERMIKKMEKKEGKTRDELVNEYLSKLTFADLLLGFNLKKE